jgi:ATP-dependent helicase HrpA
VSSVKQTRLPIITYPESLPVSQRREEIQNLIQKHQVIIVCGETGSGKTTQLPKMCLELGRGLHGKAIVHTQPRRLAATATAQRIAVELNSQVGEWVGYKIRFQDKSDANTAVKLVTDGILLAESQRDPLFKAYDTIIIDEAHERSLNIDFLLGYLKEVLPRRPDLKLIVTSATIDAERFSKHFEDAKGQPAPVIEVSGRLYPVEVRYKDPMDFDPKRKKAALAALAGKEGSGVPNSQYAPNSNRAGNRFNTSNDEVDEDTFQQAALNAIDELCREGTGDILFFLPGEREIRDMAHFLRKQVPHGTDILPLYARLSAGDQDRIFRTSGQRRIVLSTNVAETSLTVPGIRYVIDSGQARVKRYSYRNKVEMLQVERISKASANQRAGRCGRVASGVCIRLYPESDFKGRPDYTDPEILRSSLASVILRMKSLRLTEVEQFPFLQRPMGRAIADGYQLLSELNAIDDNGLLTPTGKSLAQLPVDPRIARMLVEASKLGCLREVLIIASGLSIQDPRERPHDAQEAADQAQKEFEDADSDFMSLVKLWNWFQKTKEDKVSNRDLQQKLSRKFLSPNRMREWSEVHLQLASMAKEQNWFQNAEPAKPDQVHLALLAGLLGNIGIKHETEPVYLGARGIKFSVHPSSSLFKKPGKWLMGAELIETTRLYARSVARIQPEWLERVGGHLIKKNHSDPHWEKNTGQAVAMETGTIYGLPIYSKRRVSLANFDRAEARKLMIMEGLVPGEVKTNLDFYVHNRKLIEELEKLEHKARRQDILVDESLIAAFYEERIPKGAFNQKSLEGWAKTAPQEALENLKLKKDDLLNKEAGGITTDFYPKSQELGGLSFKLSYHFEPGSPRDGVTMTVPLMWLNQVNPVRCEWLVPGMLKEKAHLLIKSLPQKLRRHLVPVPQFAEGFASAHTQPIHWEKPLLESLKNYITLESPARPTLADFRLETLPAHHFMNFKLVDEHGRQLDMQRSLQALKAEWGKQAQEQFRQSAEVQRAKRDVASEEGEESVQGRNTPSQAHHVTSASSPNKSSINHSGSDHPATKAGMRPNIRTVADGEANITSWSFGELPDLLEIQRAGQVFYGYPALRDKGENCVIEVFDEEEKARKVHHEGVLRLFSIALKDSLKYLSKNLLEFQKVCMLYMPLGSADLLRDQWLSLAITRSAFSDGLPKTEAQFNAKVLEAKSRLNLIAQEIGRMLLNTLTEYAALTKKLQTLNKAFPEAIDDIQHQMAWLMPKDFLLKHPWEQLAHFPRYIKAASARLDKARNDPARDRQNMQDIKALQMQWVRAVSQLRDQEDPSLTQFAWQLQELRVSLFAQELRTPMPVSVKRLQKAWETIQKR